MAWNPLDVVLKPLAFRRMVMAPADRLERIAKTRALAERVMKSDGTVHFDKFLPRAKQILGYKESTALLGLLLDYQSEEDGKSGAALRLFVRLNDGGSVLLLPSVALSGCDFFACEDPDRQRATVIKPTQPEYAKFLAQLRQKYHNAAEFKGEVREMVAQVQPASVSEPVALPPAPVANEAPVRTKSAQGFARAGGLCFCIVYTANGNRIGSPGLYPTNVVSAYDQSRILRKEVVAQVG